MKQALPAVALVVGLLALVWATPGGFSAHDCQGAEFTDLGGPWVWATTCNEVDRMGPAGPWQVDTLGVILDAAFWSLFGLLVWSAARYWRSHSPPKPGDA